MNEDREKACDGGRTMTVPNSCADFEECQACGTGIRWDLVDHPFFGFQHCEHKTKVAADQEIP